MSLKFFAYEGLTIVHAPQHFFFVQYSLIMQGLIMETLTKTQVREFVANFAKEHHFLPKSELVSRLEVAGVSRRTAYRILKNIETRGSSKHAGKGKAGAKPSKLGPQNTGGSRLAFWGGANSCRGQT